MFRSRDKTPGPGPGPAGGGDGSNGDGAFSEKTGNGRGFNNTYHPDAENGLSSPSGEVDELHVPCPPHTTERRLMARVDMRLLPFVVILYLLAFLDRINIGNARSFHLGEDLSLGGVEYNTALTIFFVPYVIFEIPSNMLLKRFAPNIWLPFCMLGFGVVLVCQGVVQSYGGLLATRFFLGVFECGMFPGCFYLLGMWYKRSEAQRRFSFFFSSTTLAGAFGGLLASGIGKMDGIRGYHGWRWIFIIEGIATAAVAVVFFFIFPSFPETAHWLKEDEREYIKARLQADQGHNAAERKITLSDVGTVLRDSKVWLGGFMYFGLIIPAYSYAFFAPTILSTYDYDAIHTQLFSVPPWAAAFGLAMVVAFASDFARHRFLFVVGAILISIVGFAILMTVHTNRALEYAALCLVCMGTYSAMPVIICWFQMNLGGHHRRAIGTAWQIGFGNVGGIIATYAFRQDDAPYYRQGYGICVGFVCLSFVSVLAYAWAVWRENKRREGAVRDVGITDWEKAELGDLNPEFRYML